jgi:hypothetical protein
MSITTCKNCRCTVWLLRLPTSARKRRVLS